MIKATPWCSSTAITIMTTDLALLGLMRLASPALPVGGFAYSQGLEYAVDCGWVKNAAGAEAWLAGVMVNGLTCLDIPLLCRLYSSADNLDRLRYWNDRVFACRESLELRREEQQMGRALWRLLKDVGHQPLPDLANPSWLAAFAVASVCWGVECRQACLGFLWSWLENQLTVAAKTVPIGQTDVQRINSRLLGRIVDAVDAGMNLEDDDISGGLPGLVMASMKHETQYSRLFRS